jgi:hypothetical protein
MEYSFARQVFAEYVKEAAYLRSESMMRDLLSMEVMSRKALFINLYNAMILHATLALEGRSGHPSTPTHKTRVFNIDLKALTPDHATALSSGVSIAAHRSPQ